VTPLIANIHLVSIQIIILAAGLGKRMHSDLPKVLHPVGGRPMLAHVIDAARALDPRGSWSWSGTAASRFARPFRSPTCTGSTQDPPQGTGQAVRASHCGARAEAACWC
jgi:bifunctional UDP-N-acetylglucosamine pyrophosphorylase/glucosamine-1-phosphate N-acetyltransferase